MADNAPFIRKPRWLTVKAPTSPEYLKLRAMMQREKLQTVCQSASCPNIGGCWHDGHAAFMILGNICTRNCTFCDVPTGRPAPVDFEEPQRLAKVVQRMGLRHVVITSVDRDDLEDGGAAQFVACLDILHGQQAGYTIEVLTPDFRDKSGALEKVLFAKPTIFNHNIETVQRLFTSVRPAADYRYSLDVLKKAADYNGASIQIKSGFMVGLGEHWAEVVQLLDDLRDSGVTLLTVGQYLRPSLKHHPVESYWPPERFDHLKEIALQKGFVKVMSNPLARSSIREDDRAVKFG
ncbi:MAG: lipoyl synthase [Magnetococcales bacterium]|nr:lipoyl synthase [Magnetococcales bacterium]